MSKLKSEIEQYLLENDFSLVDDIISSDTMFVYKSKMLDWFDIVISSDANDNHVICYFESEMYGRKKTHVDRMILTSLEQFKFLSTHCLRSPLCNSDLVVPQIH